jgi:hypothetical protein
MHKNWFFNLKDYVWHPTSLGNGDVLICMNAPFMTQRVLKPWWLWIYQNSAVKRASVRAIPGWVTSWEVWYGELKADNIVSLWVGRYKWYQSIAQPEMGGVCTSPWRSPARTLGPKGGWLWHPTSPENGDVLIYMNAPFMTQRVLKPW